MNYIKKIAFISVFAGFCIFTALAKEPEVYSKLITRDAKGKLAYTPYSDKGDVIPDFSNCGYMGGGVDLPTVAVVATIAPSQSSIDDSPRIQAVIDSVAKLKIDPKGFRGAILLKKGTYKIANPLSIIKSGIVLRGEGNNKENGTILLAVTPKQYNVIEIGGKGRPSTIPNSEYPITDKYVPVGSKTIHVEQANEKFKKGDKVIVRRPSTKEWIHYIGMDSIAPRALAGESNYQALMRFRREGSSTNMNGTVEWAPGSKDLIFERTIVDISGDKITIDIPIVNALQAEFGGAKVYLYKFPQRVSQCGVENLYGMSIYDASVTQKYDGVAYCSDEKHANNFVFFLAAENSWVKNVNVEQFDCCVWTTSQAKFITGQDLSATNPVSIITGGRRYAYCIGGQMILFERCYANSHRHAFVLGASAAGPNAFVDSKCEMSYASSEPHQRWSAGCLYDNITISGPEGALAAINRGSFGSGHGWAGAQIVFWNCSAPLIMVMQPPTAQNFAIGSSGIFSDNISERSRNQTLKSFNSISMSNFVYKGYQSVGDGWIEHPDVKVSPEGLYHTQLKERLGK